MTGARRNKQPTFFWQGVLILLPAVLMAAIGLYSLRQDRALAEHEARERAKTLAAGLFQYFSDLLSDASAAEKTRRFRAFPTEPEEDPVRHCAGTFPGGVAFLVDDAGSLLYPPPLSTWPDPEPLDFSGLSPGLAQAWLGLEESAYAGGDFTEAVARHKIFLGESVPARFAALARHNLALLLFKSGEVAEARAVLEKAMPDFDGVQTESGFPLQDIAALTLFRIARAEGGVGLPVSLKPPSVSNAESSPALLDLPSYLGVRAVLWPSPLSRRLLGLMDESEGFPPAWRRKAEAWQTVWRNHEEARAFYRDWSRTHASLPGPRSFEWTLGFGGRKYFASSDETESGSNRWWTFRSEEALRSLVADALRVRAGEPYLGFAVELGGRALNSVPGGGDPLAVAAGAGGEADSPLRVTAVLANPAALYAYQRTRRLWFGSLIGLSAVSVLAGFLAARRSFVRQQRLGEMKSNFVSSVSHELRAPIASVRLMAEELEDLGAADRRKSKEYHRFIVQECRRLSGLIENVLDFSRHEQGRKEYEFEPTDLPALVAQTAKMMEANGRDIKIETVVSGPELPMELDGGAIQQVLVNLLDNAIKHSPPQGRVSVRLEYGAASAVISVADRGPGIPAEDHQRIFERFFRRGSELRRETQGIGLGLAIVKYVVEAHGGKVSVKSEVGKGSEFIVEIPARNRDAT